MNNVISALFGFLGISGRPSTKSSPQFVYVQIPEQLGPVERGAKYGRPLDSFLKAKKVGEVSGGGSQLTAPDEKGNRQIEYIGLDVDLSDFDRGIILLKEELVRLAVPSGTLLQYTRDGVRHSEAVT